MQLCWNSGCLHKFALSFKPINPYWSAFFLGGQFPFNRTEGSMSQSKRSTLAMWAYILPFVLYLVPTSFETSNSLGLSYELICTAKGVLAALAFWRFRDAYPTFSRTGFGLAVVCGFVGILLWIGFERLQSLVPGISAVSGWLISGNRAGFDPFADGAPSPAQIGFIVVRMIELVAIVPLIEEVFWRGFLSRYLISEDFQSVAPGTFTNVSFVIVTAAFASVHPEILSAIAWCMLANFLYWKTQNIWACVLMHSVTNGLLGIYVLATKSWHLW
jgi:CAAX prenyl protease-like protein